MGALKKTMLLTENLSHLSDNPHFVAPLIVIPAKREVISWTTKGAEELEEFAGGAGGEAIAKLLLAVFWVMMQLEFMLRTESDPVRTLVLI